LFSKWILSELQKTVKIVREKLDEFEFDQAAMQIYHFFWDKFCNWYLEVSKIYLKDPKYKISTQKILLEVLKSSLKLLHPFIPFITEEIWQYLPERETEHIIIAKYPVFEERFVDENAEKLVQILQELIIGIRSVKAEYNLTSKTDLNVIFRSSDNGILNFINDQKKPIKFLAKVSDIELSNNYQKKKGEVSVVLSEGEIFINLAGLIDIEKEIKRLKKEKEKIEKKLLQIERKLKNREFLEKAPKEVVEKEKFNYKEFKERLNKIIHYLSELS